MNALFGLAYTSLVPAPKAALAYAVFAFVTYRPVDISHCLTKHKWVDS